MKIKNIFIILFAVTLCFSAIAQKKPSEKLFMAQFTLKRLEPAKLTEAQMEKFEKLCEVTNKKMTAIKTDAGISKEVMHHRDEIFNKLRDSGEFERSKLETETIKRANFTEKQAEGFLKLEKIRHKFNKSAKGLLTAEQKTKVSAAKKKKTRN